MSKRCGECGWPNNADTADECEKCGAALSPPSAPPVSSPTNPATPPAMGGDGKKTVMGGGHNLPSWDEGSGSHGSSSSSDSNSLKCSSCGFYPLRATPSALAPCPNCGFTGAGAQATVVQNADKSKLKKTQMFGEISFDDAKPSKFKLVENNKQEHAFEGKNVTIGREDIDPENFSLSSEHATFEKIDGKWMLSNNSSNGFTFIQVKGKVEVKDGDIIVVGNKIFQFKIDE